MRPFANEGQVTGTGLRLTVQGVDRRHRLCPLIHAAEGGFNSEWRVCPRRYAQMSDCAESVTDVIEQCAAAAVAGCTGRPQAMSTRATGGVAALHPKREELMSRGQCSFGPEADIR
jgi:hypothetical protein